MKKIKIRAQTSPPFRPAWAKFVTTWLIAVILSSAVHAKQRNVLFIAVDDMNDWVSVLGSDIPAITPNIDRLAARGLNFTNARTPGTYCVPARSAIFTG